MTSQLWLCAGQVKVEMFDLGLGDIGEQNVDAKRPLGGFLNTPLPAVSSPGSTSRRGYDAVPGQEEVFRRVQMQQVQEEVDVG